MHPTLTYPLLNFCVERCGGSNKATKMAMSLGMFVYFEIGSGRGDKNTICRHSTPTRRLGTFVLRVVGYSSKAPKMAMSLETFVYHLPNKTHSKIAYRSTGAERNVMLKSKRQNHNLQKLHAKTPFWDICVERCGIRARHPK
jgi:hypothetical protein